jgi:hypothetical protein
MTQDEIIAMARRAGAHDDGNEFRFVELRYLERFAALVAAPLQERIADLYKQLDEAERELDSQYKLGMEAGSEVCAEKTGEFARKWWSIHCESNKHMETTLKAHQDFCALQSAIRSRKTT